MAVFFSKLADSFKSFFANPIFLSCLTSWFFSQFVKGIITLFPVRKKTFRDIIETFLWRTGGMPSSHAAVVTSMTTSVAFSEGFGSNLFSVSLFMAFVVMRDAMGVRRAVGIQARAINLLARNSAEIQGNEFNPVKEIRGHAPLEVIVGAIIGILISAAYAWL